MKKTLIKFFDKIILVILGIVGVFTGCKHACTDSGDMVLMYGVISEQYEIKGTVKNKANSNPIPNIQIIRQINKNYSDTLYTDSKGNYVYTFYDYSIQSGNPVHLKLEDIDGEENGGDFAIKEIDVKFTKINRDCSGYGEKYAKTENIKLEKKGVK
jgi:putative lipoprotein (rSAM/lipoprotein system)